MHSCYGRSLSRLLPVLAILLPICWAIDCREDIGILVDIHNRQVGGRNETARYGLSFSLGTPPQNDALWPSLMHNGTSFSATDYCGVNNHETCLDGSRGFFAVEDSSSWQTVSLNSSDNSTLMFGTATHLVGRDTLSIGQTKTFSGPQTLLTIDQFPATILSNYTSHSNLATFYGPGSTLGLGPSSTILDKLVENKLIAARTFGLYLGPGFDGLGNQGSGSLVLGGYDAGRFNSSPALYNQVPAVSQYMYSPFKITVEQVSWVTSGGEEILSFTDSSFDAYITTDSRPIQFPKSVTEKIAKQFKANSTEGEDPTLRFSAKFVDNLAIKLSNNLTLFFDSTWMTDSSFNTPISAGPLEEPEFPSFAMQNRDAVIFGAAFLARAYLLVNYDAQPPNFALAQAIPDTTRIQPHSYCPNEVLIAGERTDSHSKGSSRKALIGGFCGGLLAGSVVLALIWIYFGSRIRKYLRRNDPRLQSYTDDRPGRPTIQETIRCWIAKSWNTVLPKDKTKDARYAYVDVKASSRVPSFDSEKIGSVHSFTSPQSFLHRVASPMGVFIKSSPKDIEKGSALLTHTDRSLSSYVYNHHISNTVSLTSGPVMHNTSPPIMISAYNTQARGGLQAQHVRNGSRSKSSSEPMSVISPNSMQVPLIMVEAIPERPVYDKSLPATPATSMPPTPVSRLSQISLSPGDAVPPMPAMPASFATGTSVKDFQHLHGTDQSLINHAQDVQRPNPKESILKSNVYAFLRSKMAHQPTLHSSSTSAPPLLLVDEPTTEMEATKFSDRARARRRSQRPQRTPTTSTSSSRRSRHALATRLARIRELQPAGVREIIIRRQARHKSTLQRGMLEIYPVLPVTTDPVSSEQMHVDSDPTSTPTNQANLIKRKPVAKSTTRRSRAVSGISSCVSAVDDEYLDAMGDGAISPVSSMGRSRSRARSSLTAPTPPLPPFPPGFQIHRS